MQKKTLILGASENPARYSYLALERLTEHGHPVVAIGRRNGKVGNTEITKEHNFIPDVDTVTLYLNPTHQEEYLDYIISLHPKRIIFNPGTENPKLRKLAKENGIEPIEACTLVMLSTGQY
jgi:uncharacterized protein